MNVTYIQIHQLFENDSTDWLRSCSVCGATVHALAAERHTASHQEQNA